MNHAYIIKLIDSGRYGMLQKLMVDNKLLWSKNDFIMLKEKCMVNHAYYMMRYVMDIFPFEMYLDNVDISFRRQYSMETLFITQIIGKGYYELMKRWIIDHKYEYETDCEYNLCAATCQYVKKDNAIFLKYVLSNVLLKKYIYETTQIKEIINKYKSKIKDFRIADLYKI